MSQYSIETELVYRFSCCTGYEQHPETGMVRRCTEEEGHNGPHKHTPDFYRELNKAKKLLLTQWNRAVRLWDNGDLFSGVGNPQNQGIYSIICTSYLIPEGWQEPHCVAEGK